MTFFQARKLDDGVKEETEAIVTQLIARLKLSFINKTDPMDWQQLNAEFLAEEAHFEAKYTEKVKADLEDLLRERRKMEGREAMQRMLEDFVVSMESKGFKR